MARGSLEEAEARSAHAEGQKARPEAVVQPVELLQPETKPQVELQAARKAQLEGEQEVAAQRAAAEV